MDLAWHGRRDLAELFLAAYARESDDYDIYSVIDFYESYRAYVRAKICAIGYGSPGIGFEASSRLERDARRYLLLALAAERPSIEPPRLIAMGGIIASGKSALADALGHRCPSLCPARIGRARRCSGWPQTARSATSPGMRPILTSEPSTCMQSCCAEPRRCSARAAA